MSSADYSFMVLLRVRFSTVHMDRSMLEEEFDDTWMYSEPSDDDQDGLGTIIKLKWKRRVAGIRKAAGQERLGPELK